MWTYNYPALAPDELEHHGVLGMRWGVRKSKSSSRKLTSIKQYDKDKDKRIKAERKNASKNRRSLSDAEIKRRIERLKLEKQLKDLTASDISSGKECVKNILGSAAKRVGASAAAGAIAYGTKVAMTKDFNIKEAASYIASNPNKKK